MRASDLREKPKTRQQLVAEMAGALTEYLAGLPPEEAEQRISAALQVAASAKSRGPVKLRKPS
jgi:hypothetical protein